ncbi:hypothetical protein ACJ5NV_17665 [Loktanella agnita]|uniref:hypothetical protein n=1 Tax=Loktanella agnita TaxID=287097 RepID=UPI003989BD58
MNSISSLKTQVVVVSVSKTMLYAAAGLIIGRYIQISPISPATLIVPDLAEVDWLMRALPILLCLFAGFLGWASTLRDRVLVDVAVLIRSIEEKA